MSRSALPVRPLTEPGLQLYCMVGQHSACGLKPVCTCPCHQGITIPNRNKEKSTMQCPECGNTFKNQHGLRIHQGRHHKDTYRVQIVSAHKQALEVLIRDLEAFAGERNLPFAEVCEAAVVSLRASAGS
jgi:uncharacterized C2H2 Zn-finger protein